MNAPMKVAVTGAAGQIGYSLLFRIANGDLLGPDTPVEIHLVELPMAEEAAKGVVMELEDGAFPLLAGTKVTSSLDEGFGDVDVALLVGARPRGPGMERADLLQANGTIFIGQGQAIDANAKEDVKVVVVGNPCNTNAWIAAANAKRTNPANYTAMTRLDQNRAIAQLSKKAGASVTSIEDLVVWGNHSSTMFPNWFDATINGNPITEVIQDESWLQGEFLTTVQKRGAAIIQARGKSSAASAANAALDHTFAWATGAVQGSMTSMVVPSDGSYGIPEGLMFSFPVRIEEPWKYSIISDLEINAYAQEKIAATRDELVAEREAVKGMV